MNKSPSYAIIIVKEGDFMSFDINPNRNLSNVQASSKTSGGGAGNTGYFQRGEAEEESIEFSKDYPDDSFERQGEETVEEESLISIIKNLISDFLSAIKNFFTK